MKPRTRKRLPAAQLAGIRLLILAGLWQVGQEIMNGLVFGADNPVRQALGGFTLDVPRLGQLLKQPEIASIGLAWVSLYCELIRDVLELAVKGHEIIGILRTFWFLCVPEYIQALAGGNRGRILEPLLLLLQGNHGGLFFLPDLCRLVPQTARAAALCRGVHGGFRR